MYIEHYGLSGAPFQLTPDARFWFSSRTHKKAMAYLGYGLSQAEGFIAITGEIGAGKSTLVAHLLSRIDRTRLNAVEIVSTQVEGDDLLRLVALGLGLPGDGVSKAGLLERVEQALEEEFRSGKRTLIVVDEAQNLSVSALEELRMLSNFQNGGRALVQVLLLGQPEFRSRLDGEGLEQLRQRVIATHHLEPMGEDEIEAYVRHRLALVGWNGRPGFAEDVWETLYRFTGGLPRRLNKLLNRVLLHGAVEGLEEIDGEAVDTVAAELVAERHGGGELNLPRRAPRKAPEPPQPQPEPEEEPAIAPQSVAQQPAPRPRQEPREESRPAPSPAQAAADPSLEARLAALEARLAEQDAHLRRILGLLIDWAETDAGPGDGRSDRGAGTERRFRAI